MFRIAEDWKKTGDEPGALLWQVEALGLACQDSTSGPVLTPETVNHRVRIHQLLAKMRVPFRLVVLRATVWSYANISPDQNG